MSKFQLRFIWVFILWMKVVPSLATVLVSPMNPWFNRLNWNLGASFHPMQPHETFLSCIKEPRKSVNLDGMPSPQPVLGVYWVESLYDIWGAMQDFYVPEALRTKVYQPTRFKTEYTHRGPGILVLVKIMYDQPEKLHNPTLQDRFQNESASRLMRFCGPEVIVENYMGVYSSYFLQLSDDRVQRGHIGPQERNRIRATLGNYNGKRWTFEQFFSNHGEIARLRKELDAFLEDKGLRWETVGQSTLFKFPGSLYFGQFEAALTEIADAARPQKPSFMQRLLRLGSSQPRLAPASTEPTGLALIRSEIEQVMKNFSYGSCSPLVSVTEPIVKLSGQGAEWSPDISQDFALMSESYWLERYLDTSINLSSQIRNRHYPLRAVRRKYIEHYRGHGERPVPAEGDADARKLFDSMLLPEEPFTAVVEDVPEGELSGPTVRSGSHEPRQEGGAEASSVWDRLTRFQRGSTPGALLGGGAVAAGGVLGAGLLMSHSSKSSQSTDEEVSELVLKVHPSILHYTPRGSLPGFPRVGGLWSRVSGLVESLGTWDHPESYEHRPEGLLQLRRDTGDVVRKRYGLLIGGTSQERVRTVQGASRWDLGMMDCLILDAQVWVDRFSGPERVEQLKKLLEYVISRPNANGLLIVIEEADRLFPAQGETWFGEEQSKQEFLAVWQALQAQVEQKESLSRLVFSVKEEQRLESSILNLMDTDKGVKIQMLEQPVQPADPVPSLGLGEFLGPILLPS